MIEEEQNSRDLTSLERQVLQAVILGHSEFSGLMAQLDAATVMSRTPSGVGFVTKLKVPEDLSIEDCIAVRGLPTIEAEHPNLPSGAEFVFQIKGGRLNCIEAYCFEGIWPANESLFRLLPKS